MKERITEPPAMCCSRRSNRLQGTGCFFIFLAVVQCLPLLALAISSDAAALLDFMKELNETVPKTIKNTWNESKVDIHGCPSGWYGVFCANGTIHGLVLENLGLFGVIKPGSLGKLAGLTYLSLANNAFTGVIPEDLGGLNYLGHLHLHHNQLNGSIPASFKALFNLANLSLAENKLSGAIPEIFGNMSLLEDLDLSGNSFSGGIPSTLAQLPHLYSLNLSHNILSNSSAFKTDSLHNLEILDLHQNQLSGEINPEWLNFNKLQILDLSANQFSGLLPWQQAGSVFANVVYLNLSCNQLFGILEPQYSPTFFANNLQILDLSCNKISGELPSFNFASSLKVLRLKNNAISGSIPAYLISDQTSILEELDLSRNNFSGLLNAISAPKLKVANFSYNNLSGTIPTKLGNSCVMVDLSNNQLSGNLSALQDWGHPLEVLDLSNNVLTGDLPTETTGLAGLVYMNLSHNALSGFLPPYSIFRSLSKLDLSANHLIGRVPNLIFRLPALTELKLSDNHFAGRIAIDGSFASGVVPDQFATPNVSQPPISLSLSPLSVLDLSLNSFNDSIPEGIDSLRSLQFLNLSHNMLIGVLPSGLHSLTSLKFLDLSWNELSGPLPSHLPSSLSMLNVSHNKFSGVAPLGLACKYPYSTFFPGNPQLQLTAGSHCHVSPQSSSKGPKGPIFLNNHKRGLSSTLRATLIGGCTAAALFLVASGFVIYHKRMSRKFEEVRRSPEFEGAGRRLRWRKGKGHHAHKANFGYRSQGELAQSSEAIAIEHHVPPGNGNGFHNGVNEEEAYIVDDASRELIHPTRPKFSNLSPFQRQAENSGDFPQTAELSTDYLRQPQEWLTGDLIVLDNSMRLTAEELSNAPAEVVGISGHGITYKATLSPGHMLAVKWLRVGVISSRKEFVLEAKKLSTFKHPNVLQVRGCYWGPGEHEKLVLSDFVGSGSLAAHLSERTDERLRLTWSQRICIAVDIASGLTYLHVEQRLPHGNLKATNVLLEGPEFDGKLADYGLHRLFTSAGTSNQLLNAGALGYLAPELVDAKKAKPTFGADVYAFGIILMELLTGKSAGDIILGGSGVLDLPDWVSSLAIEGRSSECFDQCLVGHERDQELPRGTQQVLEIALKCISPFQARPNMKAVYEELVAVIPN